MPFTAHLAELRSRLIKSVLAVAVAFSVCYAYVEEIFAVLSAPLHDLHVRGLMLIGTAVTEAFFTKLKIAFFAALILASPVLFWQAWQFVAPGLYEHEKRYTRSFVFFGTIFFIAGALFCIEIVLRYGLGFLLHRYEEIDIQPLLEVGDYLSVVTRLVLIFGIMFELPVLAFFLARLGVIDHRLLIRHGRYAVIAIALFAAVLTPPDLISQVLLMVPLTVIYGLSIVAAYIARFWMDRREAGEK